MTKDLHLNYKGSIMILSLELEQRGSYIMTFWAGNTISGGVYAATVIREQRGFWRVIYKVEIRHTPAQIGVSITTTERGARRIAREFASSGTMAEKATVNWPWMYDTKLKIWRKRDMNKGEW